MEPKTIIELVMALGVIPGLFVWLLFDTRKEHAVERLRSENREVELLSHIQKSDETQGRITESISKISDNMIAMRKDIEHLKSK
ncbi:MAG TPA: hypothetical protein VMV86_01155 [Methanosarcinales archaeon]|nr:hypothetical protein [Methanosarcinales archaeon]